MQNYFSEKHLFVEMTRDVSDICEDFCKKFEITFVDHIRFFQDGSCYILTNHRDWLNYHFNKQYRLIETPPKEILISEKARIVPPYSYVTADIESHFNVQCPFILLDFQEKSFDLFCFASTQKKTVEDSINCYMNHVETFEKFAQHFKEKTSRLISVADKQRLFLPKSMRENVVETFETYSKSVKKKKLLVDFNHRKVILTPREYQVVEQMAMGNTMKDVAKILDIVPKAVEFHLTNIRRKTNCMTTKQLIRYFLNSVLLKQ